MTVFSGRDMSRNAIFSSEGFAISVKTLVFTYQCSEISVHKSVFFENIRKVFLSYITANEWFRSTMSQLREVRDESPSSNKERFNVILKRRIDLEGYHFTPHRL